MKPDSTRAATARVLADIDAAVRPVERARTAAAVDRVLTSAAPSIWGAESGEEIALVVCEEFGLGFDCLYEQHNQICHDDCDDAYPARDSLPGLHDIATAGGVCGADLAPWNVSPHLFPTDPS